jgi:hypothetical protein
MSGDPTRPPHDDDAARLRELEARLAALDDEVQRFRDAQAEEVVTRRLVVLGADDFVRVEIAARDSFGHVTVYGRTYGSDSTCVELFANDPADTDGPEVGVALTVGGDVVATLHVLAPRPPSLWIEGSSPEGRPDAS